MTGSIYTLIRELTQFDQYFPKGLRDASYWHYTSADGLKGILRADGIQLWFTRSDHLNDSSEGGEIFTLYDKVRAEWNAAHPDEREFEEVLQGIDIPDERYLLFYNEAHMPGLRPMACDAYICSLSFTGDSLDMWRYYSKGIDGYALEFAPQLFHEINDYNVTSAGDASLCRLFLFPVIYEDELKEQILREKIDLCAQLYQEIRTFNKDAGPESEDAAFYVRVVMRTILNSLRYCYKHPCFTSEHEIRAVIYLPKDAGEFTNGKMVLKHRGEGEEIPYVELSFQNGTDRCDASDSGMLRSVHLSPFIKRENAVEETKEYLQSAGYNVPVEQSALPVRF